MADNREKSESGMPMWMRRFTLVAAAVSGLGAAFFTLTGCYFIFAWWRPRSAGILTATGVALIALTAVLIHILRHRDEARGRALAGKLILLGLSTLFSLIMAEVLLAILSPAMTYNRAKRLSPGIFQASTILPQELKPGYSSQTYDAETGASRLVSINSFGFRGGEFTWEKPDSTFRILVLGDSFAFNGAVDDDQIHTALLQKLLNAHTVGRRRFEVINAGYADGYSPDAYIAFMLQRGFALDPDVVIMQYFVLNDFKDLLETKVLESRDGLPYRVESEYRYVDEEGKLRDKVSLKHRIPLLRNSNLYISLYELLKIDRVMLDLASLFIPDYNASNFIASNMGIEERHTYLEPDERPAAYQRAFDQSIVYIEELDKECRRRGSEFVLFLIPTGVQVYHDFAPPYLKSQWEDPNPQRQIRAALQGQDVKIFDPLQSYRDSVSDKSFYFGDNRNGHWTPEGNRITARFMYDYLVGILDGS